MEDDDSDSNTPSESKADKNSSLHAQSQQIIDALGGSENIQSVEACATRLRIAVDDNTKVDKQVLKDLGATAVLDVSGGLQAVYGGKADLYSQEINGILGTDE